MSNSDTNEPTKRPEVIWQGAIPQCGTWRLGLEPDADAFSGFSLLVDRKGSSCFGGIAWIADELRQDTYESLLVAILSDFAALRREHADLLARVEQAPTVGDQEEAAAESNRLRSSLRALLKSLRISGEPTEENVADGILRGEKIIAARGVLQATTAENIDDAARRVVSELAEARAELAKLRAVVAAEVMRERERLERLASVFEGVDGRLHEALATALGYAPKEP